MNTRRDQDNDIDGGFEKLTQLFSMPDNVAIMMIPAEPTKRHKELEDKASDSASSVKRIKNESLTQSISPNKLFAIHSHSAA